MGTLLNKYYYITKVGITGWKGTLKITRSVTVITTKGDIRLCLLKVRGL